MGRALIGWLFILVLICAGMSVSPAQVKAPAADRRSGRNTLPLVKKVRLAELKQILRDDTGKVVLVNAWATWCKPCREEMPNLLKVSRLYRQEPFRLVLISADDPDDVETKVRPALRKFGVDFSSYIMNDSTQDAFITGMNEEWSGALPATFLYDREGKLAEMKVGERSYRQFREAVNKLLRR